MLAFSFPSLDSMDFSVMDTEISSLYIPPHTNPASYPVVGSQDEGP